MAGALGAGACAALEPARIELPAGLEGRTADPVQGIGGGTKGRFEVAGLAGRFERSASRLVLFERWQQDRAAVRLAFDSAAADDAAEAACRLRGHTVTAGIVQAPVVPAAFECEFKRADGQPAARRDGTTHLVMSPLEFMQRLAALVPRPRLHLIRFHGVLAPNAKLRPVVVPQGPPAQAQAATEATAAPSAKSKQCWAGRTASAGRGCSSASLAATQLEYKFVFAEAAL
jgi:hypothetical protein